ncbi:hypothetical protein [Absidia glauca]|uniref:phosphopyruvate hydratase n=1 Tax=Absidia glauca TaxID=4829 RepID=A0A163KGY0_ABSGL|nr:hypothetical protein [Absidia glauca]
MTVTKIHARQIFDSRGNPTVEVELSTEKGVFRAAVPSGASTGTHEALELRDNIKKDYCGKGVLKAVGNVNKTIAPAFIKAKLNVVDQKAVDDFLCGLDGTKDKSKLGANAILGVSMAACKAGAAEKGVPLYVHIADLSGSKKPFVLPVPSFNVINGGSHAGNKLAMQEFMIMPTGAKSFTEAMKMGSETYHALKGVIKAKYGQDATNVGDEGGFAPNIQDNEEGLELLVSAIEKAGYTGKIKIAMDSAASEFYKDGKYDLDFKNPKSNPADYLPGTKLAELYKSFSEKYPIVSIEDAFDQDDWDNWTHLNSISDYQLVGDDLTVTNPERIKTAIEKKACNALLLKINQIGTISESLQASQESQNAGWGVMVSHRSGETEDSFIAHIVVGLRCGQIKTGAPCRSERLAKYNELLRIEEELGDNAIYAGDHFRKAHDMHDYSDAESMDDSDQATGLLSHERTALSMPRHSQQQQQQQPYRYYPDDNQDVFGDLENPSDKLDFGKRTKKFGRPVGVRLGHLVFGHGPNVMAGGGNEEYEEAKRIDMKDLYNSSFVPKRPTLVWVEQDAQDGVFTYRDPHTNDILLESIEDRSSHVYVEMKDLEINHGALDVERFEISQDAQYVMLFTNVTKQFRWSYKANIYLYHLKSKSIKPLNENTDVDDEPRISYAVWSKSGHQLAYVMNNDIYVANLDKNTHARVTFDGSATIFNGVPDWVYEEEVFGKEYSLWWSPDSTHLAYLRFNETEVPEYQVPLYTTSNRSSYPEQLKIKYPKAGSPNPLVSLHIHALDSAETIMVTKNATSHPLQAFSSVHDFDDDDRLITDVAWATTTHTHLLFKQTNRVQDHELTSLVTLPSHHLNETKVETIREYKPEDGGWIDIGQSMVHLPSRHNDKSTIRYLDVADHENGYTHLAIFSVNQGGKVSRQWLTSGEWEVVAGSVVVDKSRQLVHFMSTERSFLERHLYTISLAHEHPASTKACQTCSEDPDEHAYYDVNFSPKSGFYILNYLGPDIPRTVVRKVDNSSFEEVLNDNADLRRLLADYQLPRIRMSTVKSGSINMPAMEVLPPDFDSTKKYPVLFHVYGGPGSQLVSYQFALDWHTFVASQLGFIVVTVDGRGTGYQGREYRSVVRGKLGEYETVDQVNAAKHWAGLDYVDPARIAIWGWSYGGYMTTKVIESDDGVFATGMAVAPVTDWHYYDSIYTERYMRTPAMNTDGYQQSAVNNMTGFEHANYLLIHGTGDDNVHFQHSAVLVDKLTMANIHKYRVQFYPDSNHRISYHNANANVYHLLTEFLFDSFGGKEYAHLREETHGHFSGSLESLHH